MGGDLVKSAFDIFLPDLYEKLKFKVPPDKTVEQAVWTNFSRAVIYMVPDDMPVRFASDKEEKQENLGEQTQL